MESFDRAQCMELVECSPAAVAVHDKAAWLSIFARDAVVEDPVGSAPQRQGKGATRDDALGRFYETFIAPNGIHFEVDRDVVCGNHVMRDLTIVIAMTDTLTTRVPVHLLYELVDEDGEPRISRLAAHWELKGSVEQQRSAGSGFLWVGIKSMLRMLRHMGVSGVIGFSRASSGVGEAGKERLQALVEALAERDEPAMAALFAGPDAMIEFPRGRPVSIAECAAAGGQMQLSKVLAAGTVVTATVAYETQGASRHGVLLCEFEADSLKIQHLIGYWED